MNIPADIPSPDQENVYYSVKSLIGAMGKYFNNDSLSKIEDVVKEFYLPTFVFDDDSAPNSYQLDIYPRGDKKLNILLGSSGTILVNNKSTSSVIPLTKDTSLNDGGSKTTIDSSFYSSANLKSKDFFSDLSIDEDSSPGLELLIASKFMMNQDIKNTLMSRNQFTELIKSTVKNIFSSLPEEELDLIKEVYSKKQDDIERIIEIVNDIKTGQAETLDSIKFTKLASKVYPNIYVEEPPSREKELNLTRSNIAQSLLQLNESRGSADGYYVKTSQIKEVKDASTIKSAGLGYHYNSKNYSKVWNHVVETLISAGEITDPTIDSIQAGSISSSGDEINSIISFSKEGAQKNTFVSENGSKSWVNEWYYSNFAKILTGESTDFNGLNSFLENYQSTLTKVEKSAQLNVLAGGSILVNQAILKSILKLCQSNVDVSDYAPNIGSNDIFSRMGRSPVLGPSGCHQYPSKHDQAEDEYTISNFSKTGFLCYQAILKIISKLSNGHYTSRNFVLGNISNFDSDHDKVLKLWDDISESSIEGKQSQEVTAFFIGATSNEEIEIQEGYIAKDTVNAVDKKIAHLFGINETFEGRDIYLIPMGDKNIEKSERTFINYNLPGIKHIKESSYLKLNEILELENLKPLTDDDTSLVGEEGNLNLFAVTDEYKRMGYFMPVTVARFGEQTNDTEDQPFSYSRSSRVHYGLTNPDFWDEDELENDVFEFFKQKNYNLPYFWASSCCIYKALVVEAYREIINSINEILDVEVDLSIDQLSSMFDNHSMLTVIEKTVEKLIETNALKARSFVRIDGCITFTDDIGNQRDLARVWKKEYRNTAGDNVTRLVKNYIKFTSAISEHSRVKIVEEQMPVTYDHSTFIPPEVLQLSSNTNYSNVHGGFGSYIPDSFDEYYDVLEFRDLEYIDAATIKKNTSGAGAMDSFQFLYDGHINMAKGMFEHVRFNQEILSAFGRFKNFIDGFSVPDEAVHIFSSGGMNIENDIQQPQRLIEQIIANKEFYSADSFGISEKWNNVIIQDVENFYNNSSNWMYVYVLGVKSIEFANGKVDIVPSYIGSSGEEIELISNTKSSWQFSFNKPNTEEDFTQDETESDLVLNYLHLLKGLDLSETAFSYKTKRVFEDHITASESGVFPWTPDSFEEGIPKEPLDSIFNMSPWIYPTNYFYDVCISNEFKRVVACVIKKEHIDNLNVDSISVGSIQEIIGSIRWKIKEV
jgi:hypothetical protein